MITKAECFEFRPKDRDYNKKGKARDPQMEVLGGGVVLFPKNPTHLWLAHMGGMK